VTELRSSRPSLTVYTPSHRPRYLDEAYASLRAQTFGAWQWIVLLNGNAPEWRPPVADERVIVRREKRIRGVGAAKRAACALAEGDILVELDHDDVLASTCLERIVQAFDDHPRAVVVYSDFAQVDADGGRNDERFDPGAGWAYEDDVVDGRPVLRCQALEPTPHNVAYIWYTPNHVRAFRRTAYEAAGGYDPDLHVLDDQDLLARLYQEGDFHRIAACLYLQRVGAGNTQSDPRTNAAIQADTVAMYRDNIADLVAAWARRNGLAQVRLRVRGVPLPEREDEDVVDVDVPPGASGLSLPFGDDSVAVVHADEVLQFVPDRGRFVQEIHRVLAHGGLVLTETPSTDGRGAFQDPRHVSWWNENSFWYLTQTSARQALPELTGRFQISHLRTYFPTVWHEQVGISYVQANLLAIKEGPRQGGPLLC
jgi:glycosyltransferase involved in cell wall biosynthesis